MSASSSGRTSKTSRHGTSARWEHFEHQADIGVRGRGRSLAEAFEGAALALVAVGTDLPLIKRRRRVSISCEAPDAELLLVEWLNRLIYEMASRRMLFSAFRVRVAGARLRAEAWGDRIDADVHRPSVEVKGASYAELKVFEEPDGTWLAQCVVDV
jgi:SHS2 domain-containing protein